MLHGQIHSLTRRSICVPSNMCVTSYRVRETRCGVLSQRQQTQDTVTRWSASQLSFQVRKNPIPSESTARHVKEPFSIDHLRNETTGLSCESTSTRESGKPSQHQQQSGLLRLHQQSPSHCKPELHESEGPQRRRSSEPKLHCSSQEKKRELLA